MLTYPYPHPRPSDDLLGRVLPQPRHPFRRQTASQTLASQPQSFALHTPWREYANPRQPTFSIEATLAKTNPGSTLQPAFSPFLPVFLSSSLFVRGGRGEKEIESGGRSFARRMTFLLQNSMGNVLYMYRLCSRKMHYSIRLLLRG